MDQVYSVSAITAYLKEGMEEDPFLQDLWIKGEINNFYHHTSGHMYFTLKDRGARIRAVMFHSYSQNLSFKPKDGQEVLAQGFVSIYAPRGEYQLYVKDLKPEGIGSLFLAFQERKERLEKEGLFQESRKRPLPSFPSSIGLVTSLGGAALRDILSVLRRRYQGLEIYIAPARMQGEGTALSVIKALHLLEQYGGLHLVIISRGGGSWEELWPFNDEELARKVASSPIPVISAIGHEIDYTILDFVADLRAPTPSAAAELAVSTRDELKERLLSLQMALYQRVQARINENRATLSSYLSRPVFRKPEKGIWDYRQRIDELDQRLSQRLSHELKILRERVLEKERLLKGMGPLKVLSRGYALIEKDKEPVRSVKDLKKGEEIRVILKDGSCRAMITEKEDRARE